MTRLQKMLSQIKTVDELSELLRVSPAHIINYIGVSKDREQLIQCDVGNCEKCALYQGGHCISHYENMIKYFNAEISSTDDDHAPVIKMRDNARKILKKFVIESFKVGISASTVYRYLDDYIDLLENVGLFEENELRTYVSTDLTELKTGKKENHK